MANCRKKGKVQLNMWLTPDEKKMLEESARKCGLPMTDFLKNRIYAYYNKNEATNTENKET